MTQLNRFTRGFLVALFCGSLAWADSTALAAKGGKGGGGGGGGGGAYGGGNNTTPPAPTVDPAIAAQARQDAAAAQLAVAQVQSSVDAAQLKLKKAFEESDAYKAALAEMRTAQTEFDAAKTPVLAALRTTPDYKTAKAAKVKAEADRDAMASEVDVKPAARMEIATLILNAGTTLTTMEASAINGDSAATGAKARVDAAVKNLAAIMKQFKDSMKDDPEVLAAQKDLSEKMQKLVETRTALAAALR